jgi:hypothetical protein
MKTIPGLLLAAVLVVAPAAPAAAQDLQLSMRDGRVTLIANNVPVSRILAEWARVGQATVLNGEKLTGPPLTLHFENQPERDVLEVLLRSAAGYIVAPRQVSMADAAVFDRILIMPTSRAPAVSAAPPPQFRAPPTPPVQIQPAVDDEPPNDPVMPPGAMPPGAMPPGAMPPGVMPPGAMPPGAMPNPNMPNPNVPTTQPVPGMPSVPATQPRPGMPVPTPGGPGGVQPNPYVPQPQLPPGVRPPGGGGSPDDR